MEELNRRQAEIEDKKIAKQEEVLIYLTSILRGEQTEQTLINAGEGYQKIVDIEVGAKDRIRAAELLGKRYGAWTDRLDVSGGVVFLSGEDELDD